MNKQIKQTNRYLWSRRGPQTLLCGAALLVAPLAIAQEDADEEVFELSPFTVEGSENVGYRATSTLAGTRIRTDLKDVGSAISVYTEEFLRDTGSTNAEGLLVYTTNTEVGGANGNFSGNGNGSTVNDSFSSPNQSTRVRGLAAADNTRNYFLSDIPWDGYNVDRVDMQRGPNAILFGLGSPAGIINTTTRDATFSDDGEVSLRFGSFGSLRGNFRLNRQIIEDELAVIVAGVNDDTKYRQKPAFNRDTRLYVGLKYDPKFLKSDSMSTSIRASYENGSVESNRPRVIPPMDRITAFFRPVGSVTTYQVGDSTVTRNYGEAPPAGGIPLSVTFPQQAGMGGMLFDPYDVESQSDIGLGFGANRATVQWPNDPNDPDSATSLKPNPYYVPMWGNYSQNFASPLMVFPDANSASPSGTMVHEIKQWYGIGPTGAYDSSFNSPYGRIGSVDTYQQYALDAKLPLNQTGTYKNVSLTDPSVFDFYNKLIDGPNKEEWNDFNSLNLALSQTFLNNKLGYELAYYSEETNHGNVSVMGNGGNIALFIDTNAYLGDGTPNPNAGRPFVSDASTASNQEVWTERSTFRATVYGEYDFRDLGSDNWVTRLLGRHRATGLWADDNHERDQRQFARYRILSEEFADMQMKGGYDGNALSGTGADYFANELTLNTTHYLGESLYGRSSGAGAYIPNITAEHNPPRSGAIRLFDNRWAGGGVNPAAWWDANGNNVQDLNETQSENPANYVGWRDIPYDIVYWDDTPTAREDNNMYRQGQLSKSNIKSEALVWQGYFWDNAVVGTYGWRRDKPESWQLNGATDSTHKYLFTDPSSYSLDEVDSVKLEGESQSWSVVAHANNFVNDALPFNLSFGYNSSENFQPAAGRVDIYGQPLPPPSGQTTDKSVLISTKDNRYSLKVTKYDTRVRTSNSSYIDGTWFIGNVITWGTTWANIAQYNLKGDTIDTQAPQSELDGLSPTDVTRYNWGNPTLEAASVAEWRKFTAAIPQEWLTAWGIDGNLQTDIKGFGTNQGPAGLTYTQDAISRGTEYEFTAQPTDNWRISINASHTEAERNNVGGESFKEWVTFVDSWLQDTAAGDMRVWWGSAGPLRDSWNATFRSNYSLLELLEGTATPEIRPWAYNVVTNYDFKDGFLSGVNVGASYRWQDKIIIGYPIGEDADGKPVFDLDNPYHGPTEDSLDLWVGYRKSLTDKVDWRVQLNVRDALAESELIPLNVQPDGTPAAYRIAPSTTWQLTNTFSF